MMSEGMLRSSAMTDDAIECRWEPRAEMLDEDESSVHAAAHDPQAAGRLYDRHYARIFGYVYRCTLDRMTAEDLTSNVFLAAFAHLGRFRWRQAPFQAWLYRIATNEVRTFFRRRNSARAARLQIEHGAAEGSAPAADQEPGASEEYRLVHEALLELRAKHRTVIILRYFEDKTMAQIAEITGSREGTVRSQLHRGLARLQEILTERGVLPE